MVLLRTRVMHLTWWPEDSLAARLLDGAYLTLFAIVIGVGGAWLFSYLRSYGTHMLPQELYKPGIVVCIDPGHPTPYNSGNSIHYGLSEVQVNWDIAQKLRLLLENDYRVRVVMTRKDPDRVMGNRARAEVANKANATLTIHLHCDAGPSSGFTVFYPDRKGTDVGRTGPSRSVIDESVKAADVVHAGMAEVLSGKLVDRGVKGESHTKIGRENGALTCSIFSEVPTVTVEMVFLTQQSDAEFIAGKEGQDRMTIALARVILKYIDASAKERE